MKKLFILVLLISGCTFPARPIYDYKISIISPDGNTQKNINITSHYELETVTHLNGTMSIREKNPFENKTHAIAPVSWYIDYELVKTTVEKE